MLPNPDDRPSGLCEPAIGISIPSSIRFNLGAPELAVAVRLGCVLRASVPEAAVNEDGDPRWAEDDVNSAATVSEHGPIDSEPQPAGMQRPPQRNFGAGVPASYPRHAPTSLG